MNEQFHEERQKGIGGSDVPVLLGKSPYKSAYQLYLDKRGLLEREPEPDNGALYHGKLLESLVLSEFAKANNKPLLKVSPEELFFTHPENDWMLCHLDGIIATGNGDNITEIVEAKTSGQYRASEWGEEMTDEIPEDYILQCQHNMYVTGEGVRLAWVPVLIGGNNRRCYKVERNDKLISNLIEIEKDFWFNHVQAEVPPEVDGSERTAKALSKMFAIDTGEAVEANDEIMGDIRHLADCKERIDDTKSQIELHKNRIKVFLRHKSIITRDGKIFCTWKKAADGIKTDYKAIVTELNPDAGLIKKHTEKTIGSRRVLPKYKLIEELQNDSE